MIKWTEAFTAQQEWAKRPDALLTELAARLLEIDMGERLAAIVPDDLKQALVSSSVQGGDKRGQAEVAAETHKPPRLRPQQTPAHRVLNSAIIPPPARGVAPLQRKPPAETSVSNSRHN
jgi:hypothetical protein